MTDQTLVYVTYFGIPLSFKLNFPFHPSSAGADWHVLHGTVTLEDGSGRIAEVAVQMSQAVKGALPSVEEKDALGPAINAIRKATDTRDIEFQKSNKKQPIALSSRAFSIVTRQFTFQKPDDAQLVDFTRSKIFWLAKLGQPKVRIADPVDTLYLTATNERMLEAAKKLAAQGLARLEGEFVVATEALKTQTAEMEARMQKALAEIEAKHAFERA